MRAKQTVAGVAAAVVAAGVTAVAIGRGSDPGDAAPHARGTQDSSCDTVAMHIRFERSGGFAGMTVTASLNTDSLAEDERRRLCQLIEDADFFNLPGRLMDSVPQADGYTYEIAITADDRTHTVVTVDGAAPARLVPLLDWLSRAARRSRGR